MPDKRPSDWHDHLITTKEGITALLDEVRTVAVLGVKPRESFAPAYLVPRHAQRAGMRIIPVPVYYPELEEMLGERVYRTISAIPEPVDMVDVFRKPQDIPAHLNDIIAAKPKAVWFQSGITNDEAAETLARAGIDVVQDRCLMIELRDRGR